MGDSAMAPTDRDKARRLAVLAEALYLANLLVLPGLAFLWLLLLAYRNRHSAPPLARCHLRQAVVAALWAGGLLLPITVLTVVVGGYQSIGAWTAALLYFTVCHATLVLLGVVGLTKAMAEREWRYPLIGARGGKAP